MAEFCDTFPPLADIRNGCLSLLGWCRKRKAQAGITKSMGLLKCRAVFVGATAVETIDATVHRIPATPVLRNPLGCIAQTFPLSTVMRPDIGHFPQCANTR